MKIPLLPTTSCENCTNVDISVVELAFITGILVVIVIFLYKVISFLKGKKPKQ